MKVKTRKTLALLGMVALWVSAYYDVFGNLQQMCYITFVVTPVFAFVSNLSKLGICLSIVSIVIVGILSYFNCFSLNFISFLIYFLGSLFVDVIILTYKHLTNKQEVNE